MGETGRCATRTFEKIRLDRGSDAVGWPAVMSHWTEQTVFFLDFEGSLASGILEYGVVMLVGGRIIAAQTRLCRATGGVSPEDAAVHGLREDDLAAYAPFADDWELFAALRERGPLAAHYAAVENSLLKSVWPYPRMSPDFARPGERVPNGGRRSTPPAFRSSGPRFRKAGEPGRRCGGQAELDALAQAHCPPDRRRYHAALYDALAGAWLLARLRPSRRRRTNRWAGFWR